MSLLQRRLTRPVRGLPTAWLPEEQRGRPDQAGAARRRLRGHLVTFSGLDGSGKTTVATWLVEALREHGVRATYFYGHRPSYHRDQKVRSLSILFRAIWRHIGRVPEELREHPRAKVVYDFLTFLDYVLVQRKLARHLRPDTVVLVDRYVYDVIMYLRFLGPSHPALEWMLLAISPRPDVEIFFDIDPETALGRKQEQTPAELQRFAAVYRDLRRVWSPVVVDARASLHEVLSEVGTIVENELGPVRTRAREGRPWTSFVSP